MQIIVGILIVFGIILYVVQWIRVICWENDLWNSPQRIKENNRLLKELVRQQKVQLQPKSPAPWFKDLDFWNQ